MHRLLQLQHHRHSGKLLSHQHTSYRILALLLVLTGGLLFWTTVTMHDISSADQLFVSATVPAPIPTTSPVILEPKDGTKTNDSITVVSGTCPVITPAVSVAIYDNGVLAASAPCSASGTFQGELTLVLGQNILIARAVTITDDQGPDSAPVSVLYALAIPSVTSSGTPSSSSGGNPVTSSPIIISSDRVFVTFGPHQSATWTGTITGGFPPYTVTLNWGDGTIVSLKDIIDGRQSFQHTYVKMVAYVLHITVIDQRNGDAIASFAVMTPYIVPTPSILGNLSGSGFDIYKYMALYGLYLATLGGFGVAWLRTRPYAYARAPVSKRRPMSTHRKRRR